MAKFTDAMAPLGAHLRKGEHIELVGLRDALLTRTAEILARPERESLPLARMCAVDRIAA